jgi:hypothetical protein
MEGDPGRSRTEGKNPQISQEGRVNMEELLISAAMLLTAAILAGWLAGRHSGWQKPKSWSRDKRTEAVWHEDAERASRAFWRS